MSSTPNINSSFFKGTYKEAWKEMAPNGLTEAEVDFILEIGQLQKGDRVLDLMCGYGRHALELGRREIRVTAVDNLREYVEEINAGSRKEQLPVTAIETDILVYQPEEQFDAAVCMGNSFAFFNREEAGQILRNISGHLKKGGVLIINSWMVAEIAIRYFKERDWHYAGDYKCVLESSFHFNPARIETEQTIISKEGTIEVVKGIDYIFTLDELDQIFQSAGLKTKQLFSTPRKRKFSLGDARIYIVAEKN